MIDETEKTWRVREDCRLCGTGDLETVLELAPTPPANEFVKADDPPQELIPLYLARCRSCGHVQLPVVVDPERLFRNYVYVSGTSPSFVEHFRLFAAQCMAIRKEGDPWVKKGDLVVDIGSNDGTLLRAFDELGAVVQGIDPAKAIAARATQAGIPTWPEFFTRDTATKIEAVHGRKAALVVANNVFAHADDLKEIALGVQQILAPGGRFVFEVQSLVDLVNKTLFDMVYHEHLSYHSLGPLGRFFQSIGMTLVDAEHVTTHGGSIRCTVAHGADEHQTDRFRTLLAAEVRALSFTVDPWGDMRRRVDAAGVRLRTFFEAESAAGRPVVGYGAPAKLTTLCHQFGISRKDISYVVDDSPWKQGLLAPGTRIPIFPLEKINPVPYQKDPHVSWVIFAWNFAEPIAKKLRAQGFTGRIVVPLPEFKEIA